MPCRIFSFVSSCVHWTAGIRGTRAALLICGVNLASHVASSAEVFTPQMEPNGKILLDNDRVAVRAFAIEPGQTTLSQSHAEPRLRVFIRGGVLKSVPTGRATLWKDGRVAWVAASSRPDEPVLNIGSSTIEFEEVTLKPVLTRRPVGAKPQYGYLSYPNIPTQDLLENDLVIVQSFAMQPGQWEGVHAHHPNTLYIFVKGGNGGHWKSRTTNPPTDVDGYSPDGDAGWMPAIDISAGHQSGNTGTEPSEVVWIALKH